MFSTKGLVCMGMLVVMCVGIAHAQIGNVIKDATNTVTQPAKDVQGVAKDIAQPAKDVNKAIRDASNAPKGVTREIDKTASEIERTKGEYEKTADQLQNATDGKGGKQDDKNKSTAATDSTKAQPAPVDAKGDGKGDAGNAERNVPPDYVPAKKAEPVVINKSQTPTDVPPPVPPGSRDNKTPSGPLPPGWGATPTVTGGTDTEVVVVNDANGNMVVQPADTAKPASAFRVADTPAGASDAADPANSASAATSAAATETVQHDPSDPKPRFVELKGASRSGEKRPKPDYSYSPARIALEKADFEIETLEDLFRYSNWEGPEREHTVRAVAQALDDLQQAIVEVRKLDPAQSTWRFEEAYKDMKEAYLGEIKRQQSGD